MNYSHNFDVGDWLEVEKEISLSLVEKPPWKWSTWTLSFEYCPSFGHFARLLWFDPR